MKKSILLFVVSAVLGSVSAQAETKDCSGYSFVTVTNKSTNFDGITRDIMVNNCDDLSIFAETLKNGTKVGVTVKKSLNANGKDNASEAMAKNDVKTAEQICNRHRLSLDREMSSGRRALPGQQLVCYKYDQ